MVVEGGPVDRDGARKKTIHFPFGTPKRVCLAYQILESVIVMSLLTFSSLGARHK